MALEILDSAEGRDMLARLRRSTSFFREGLKALGFVIIEGEHPVIPLMVRDARETIRLVSYLKENGILVVGLKFPVVPQGDECLRFQVSCDHTRADLEEVLRVLGKCKRIKP